MVAARAGRSVARWNRLRTHPDRPWLPSARPLESRCRCKAPTGSRAIDAAHRNGCAGRQRMETNTEMKLKDFESALKSLEEIVSQLEGGDLALDRALELFEEGVKISRFCNAKLEEAERKVEMLTRGGDGRLTETPFTAEDAGEA